MGRLECSAVFARAVATTAALSWVSAALAESPGFGPFSTPAAPVTRDARFPTPRPSEAAGPLALPFRFYQSVVSPIDGPRCRHRPTCSRYALLAIDRHGLAGVWLAYDRLLRDGQSSAARWLPVALEDSALRVLDPLEESTFWFSR